MSSAMSLVQFSRWDCPERRTWPTILTQTTSGMSFGPTVAFKWTSCTGWSHTSVLITFLVCMRWPGKITWQETYNACTICFQRTINSFHRPGSCQANSVNSGNSLEIKARRSESRIVKHSFLNLRLLLRVGVFFSREAWKTLTRMSTMLCRDTCINHSWLTN